jgi:hypothetical protein
MPWRSARRAWTSRAPEDCYQLDPAKNASRSVLPPLVTIAEADYSPPGVVKGDLATLAAWRSSGRRDFPALLIDRHAHDLVQAGGGLLHWWTELPSCARICLMATWSWR